MNDTTKLRVTGIGLILAVIAGFGLTAAFYTGAFKDPAVITVQTARAGLQMTPGNKVKFHGVEIGRVEAVRSAPGGAVLELEVDRDDLDRIPANVELRIQSSTVFGAKYVELVMPNAPVRARLASGDVVDSSSVTTEVNTVFERLDSLLTGVDVLDLNKTLAVLATTLEGKGSSIADVAGRADAYLTRLEPLLPELRRDLVQIARFARLGVAISPALLRILDNAAVTGSTVVTERQALDRLLVDLSVLGDRGAKVLGVNSDALVRLLRTLRPTTGTLRAYSSELPCLLQGLDETREIMAQVIGGRDAGLRARLSIRHGLPKYVAPSDLPSMPRGRGPACHNLPLLDPGELPIPERGDVQ